MLLQLVDAFQLFVCAPRSVCFPFSARVLQNVQVIELEELVVAVVQVDHGLVLELVAVVLVELLVEVEMLGEVLVVVGFGLRFGVELRLVAEADVGVELELV